MIIITNKVIINTVMVDLAVFMLDNLNKQERTDSKKTRLCRCFEGIVLAFRFVSQNFIQFH